MSDTQDRVNLPDLNMAAITAALLSFPLFIMNIGIALLDIPSFIASIATGLFTIPSFVNDVVNVVGLNIDSNLLLITPPAIPGDPIGVDLTVSGSGGINVTNPSPGVLNIDGSGVASNVEDGFGTSVRGDGSLATPYRVDTLLSSNSLEIIQTAVNGDPTAVNLTIAGSNGVTTSNPSPGQWVINGPAPLTFDVTGGFASSPWTPCFYTMRVQGYRIGQLVTLRMTQVVMDTPKATTIIAPFTAGGIIPFTFRPQANLSIATYGVITGASTIPTENNRMTILTGSGSISFARVDMTAPFILGQQAGLQFDGELVVTYVL